MCEKKTKNNQIRDTASKVWGGGFQSRDTTSKVCVCEVGNQSRDCKKKCSKKKKKKKFQVETLQEKWAAKKKFK